MAAPDPRRVYSRTPTGDAELATPGRGLTPQALRLLSMIDGRRALSQLPLSLRPAELPIRLEELLVQGLIVLVGLSEPIQQAPAPPRDPRLDAFKRQIAGAVSRELGPAGSVLEARLQDCVNLDVMRTVMREVIERVRARAGDDAALRLAHTAQDAARDWPDHERPTAVDRS